jgi:uncharacterized protein (TIGR04255 family)
MLTEKELDEVFPRPPIREVAFEIRFSPRLRVNAEIWRLQDRLVDEYSTVSTESLIQPTGMLPVQVFQNIEAGRLIKVSQQNWVIAFTRYTRFEDFKEEALGKIGVFTEVFGIKNLTRVGLRYINDIVIPDSGSGGLLRFVRPMLDFDRVPLEAVEQFVNEFQIRQQNHSVTLRGALLTSRQDGRRVYVLDIDCHSGAHEDVGAISSLLDTYHSAAQRYFLDHITEEYKNIMRGHK